MGKMNVVLLVLALSCIVSDVAGRGRKSKESRMWRQSKQLQGTGAATSVGTAGGSEPAQQPQRPTCTAAGFFPTPGSCQAFHRCVDFTGLGRFFSVFQFSCPIGTVFDDYLDICNHPSWVSGRPECGGTAAGPLTPQPTETPATSLTPAPMVPATVPKPAAGLSSTSLATTTAAPATGKTTITSNITTASPAVGSVTTSSKITTAVPATGSTTIASKVTTAAPAVGSMTTPIKVTATAPVAGLTTTEGRETTTSPDEESATSMVPVDGDELPCYNDDVYRLHPKYCNRYYYCLFENGNWNTNIFTCPAGLIYNENKQSCSSQDTIACNGTLAPYPGPVTLRPVAGEETTTIPDITTVSPSESATKKTWDVDPNTKHPCPAPGYYPFEGDCVRFYKCVETDEGKLLGLLYKCPTKYGYSEKIQRCQKEEVLPPCQKRLQAAHLRLESATQLYEEDLIWFFRNRK